MSLTGTSIAATASATLTALPPTPVCIAATPTRWTSPGSRASTRTITSCAGWSAGTTIMPAAPGMARRPDHEGPTAVQSPRVGASAQGLRRAPVQISRVDPRLRVRRVDVLLGDRIQPGRVVVLDGRRVDGTADGVGDELDRVVAHVERGLGDEPVIDSGLEVSDLVRCGVERHELDRAVLARGLDRRSGPVRGRLVRR